MKRVITFLSLLVLFSSVSCTGEYDSWGLFSKKGVDTLFITSSVGAFNGEKLQEIKPYNAYLLVNEVSSSAVSMEVYYKWGHLGFTAVIPSVEIDGTIDDFGVSAENVAARYKTYNINKVDYQDITMSINGSFKKASRDVSLDLSITPSDNTIFPFVEIRSVVTKKPVFEPGGAISEWPFSKLIVHNQLDTPVTIIWLAIDGRPTLEAQSSFSCWSDYYNPSSFPSAILVKDGNEYEINLLAEGRYSMEKKRVYHFESGGLDCHNYSQYTFNITPDLFE